MRESCHLGGTNTYRTRHCWTRHSLTTSNFTASTGVLRFISRAGQQVAIFPSSPALNPHRSRPFDLASQISKSSLKESTTQGSPLPLKVTEVSPLISVKGKRLADCLEAIIGVHCMDPIVGPDPADARPHPSPNAVLGVTPDVSAAVESAYAFMSSSGLLPACFPISATGSAGLFEYDSLKPLIKAHLNRRGAGSHLNARDERRVEAIEQIAQYTFRSRDLAMQALTHPSYPGVSRESYQRLEFVGDAVLGLIATIYVLNEG